MGHRGLSHSLVAAAALATVVTVGTRGAGVSWGRAWTLLFLATASHGLLDMCTDGGRGVAILSPWDTTRYFFPWRPIAVSPIGVRFFSLAGSQCSPVRSDGSGAQPPRHLPLHG